MPILHCTLGTFILETQNWYAKQDISYFQGYGFPPPQQTTPFAQLNYFIAFHSKFFAENQI